MVSLHNQYTSHHNLITPSPPPSLSSTSHLSSHSFTVRSPCTLLSHSPLPLPAPMSCIYSRTMSRHVILCLSPTISKFLPLSFQILDPSLPHTCIQPQLVELHGTPFIHMHAVERIHLPRTIYRGKTLRTRSMPCTSYLHLPFFPSPSLS